MQSLIHRDLVGLLQKRFDRAERTGKRPETYPDAMEKACLAFEALQRELNRPPHAFNPGMVCHEALNLIFASIFLATIALVDSKAVIHRKGVNLER